MSVAYARRSDPETSHAAAASVADVRLSQAAVLAVFEEVGPMTDEELAVVYYLNYSKWGLPLQSASGLRTRRCELVRKGLLEFSGEKTPLASGRMARVWRIPGK